ncbi:MAG TPA: hypothetical protein ENN85_02710 [Methanoculleus sp.]|nr:hypothetical protein [Methanoculleus sp.]
MSTTSRIDDTPVRFLADRMLGTLTRYLRFMGFDVLSANSLRPGSRREDTTLLEIAGRGQRILLTRDRELARRGADRAVLIESEDVLDQVRQLVRAGLIDPDIRLRMRRCSLCNACLRRASEEEITRTEYAPAERTGLVFYWCPRCRKLYWMGSHGRNLSERLDGVRTFVQQD